MFNPDDHRVQCDISGFWCLRSECRMRWDGKLVRADFWEPRQPQDFVRAHKDDTSIKDARPAQPDPPLQDPPIDANDVI